MCLTDSRKCSLTCVSYVIKLNVICFQKLLYLRTYNIQIMVKVREEKRKIWLIMKNRQKISLLCLSVSLFYLYVKK
jgi:hypothetical protein